jgi:thiamine pyrophosphate-dependent acetolactate synthase large subunit-like protein
MIERSEFLAAMAARRTDEIVVYTMSTCIEWPQLSDSPLNFYVGGAMGYASSVALGIALARPDRRVWVFDGDGSLLMNLGSTATLPAVGASNLVHFVMRNGVYQLTARVPTPDRGVVHFEHVARGAGHRRTARVADLTELGAALDGDASPTFVEVLVRPAEPAPMPAMQLRQQGPAAALQLAELLGGAGAHDQR